MLLACLSCLLAYSASEGEVYAASANSQYSLSGAQYQLYTDSACTKKASTADGSNAILTTDNNGDSGVLEMAAGTYYAKEIRAGKGYRLDTDDNGNVRVYTVKVTASDARTSPASFTSSEPPAYGAPDLMVIKTDPEGEFDYTKLIGARFAVKYYDVASRDEIAGAAPKDEWVFETVKKKISGDTYKAGFDWQTDDPVGYSHDGDGVFYEATVDGAVKRVMPLGWFTIEETAAPEGFMLSDRIVYGHVYQPEDGGDAVTVIEGTTENSSLQKDTLVFTDQPYPDLRTSASLQSGNHEVKDAISYKYLLSGESYLFKGWLVDTVTGEKVPGSDGSAVLEDVTESDGDIDVILSTEGYENMQGHSMTAFEELYLISREDGKETETLVAEHKDINDSSQTVEIYQDLKVKKNVTGNLGDRSKVFEYTAAFTGLVPGLAYTVEGFDGKVFNADSSGCASIPLKLMDDTGVTIRQLPKGAAYQITEAASDHVSEFRILSEDMADSGAKIAQASGSNGEDAAKELSTALETVDIYDGTVVVVWENNRDLATLTAVQSHLGIWAVAVTLVIAGLMMLIIKKRHYIDK